MKRQALALYNCGVRCGALALVAACVFAQAHAQSWRPEKPIEIIAASGPGGGTDKLARTIQRIEYTVFSVRADSPFKTGAELLKRLAQHHRDFGGEANDGCPGAGADVERAGCGRGQLQLAGAGGTPGIEHRPGRVLGGDGGAAFEERGME